MFSAENVGNDDFAEFKEILSEVSEETTSQSDEETEDVTITETGVLQSNQTSVWSLISLLLCDLANLCENGKPVENFFFVFFFSKEFLHIDFYR